MRKLPDEPLPPAAALGFARAAAFFATVTVVAILALLGSAQASTVASPTAPAVVAALDEEAEEEGWEEAEDEGAEEAEWCLDLEAWTGESCEEAEDEEEAEEKAEQKRGAPPAAEDCVLLGASATVKAAVEGRRVRLAVRYQAQAPTVVTVSYQLRGGKGALKLGADRQRFARGGVFTDTDLLSEKRMEKVAAARAFTVSLRAVNSPDRCGIERQLTVRRPAAGGLLWSESSARRSSR